jgi:spermidine synthase
VDPADEDRTVRMRFAIIMVLFFATGACGLVYQQLWLRELSLTFGVTVQAVSTVLAAFFGGLALGGWGSGRLSLRTRRPIAWYGIFEIAAGVLAIFTPLLLALAERVYVWFATSFDPSLGTLTVVRFALSFGVLLIPATLMGASMPLIVSSSLFRAGPLGSKVGALYAVNTAGAVLGTVVSGFWLIGWWGLERTFVIAAVVNIVCGVVATLAARRWDQVEVVATPDATPAVAEVVPAERIAPALGLATRRLVLATFAVSGLVTLALEVVWFRQLVLFLESSTYAFTVMLATVLVGITAGSAAATPLLRRGAGLRALAFIEIGVGLAALLSFYLLSNTYGVVNRAADVLVAGPLTLVIVASALAMLAATFLLGLAFPIGIELWIDGDREHSGARVGTFYACNVAAGIVGSLLAGFVLVPVFGTRTSLILLSLAVITTGVVLLFSALPRPAALKWAGLTTAVTAVVTLTLVPDPYVSVMYHRFPGEELVWKADDAQTTVSIQSTGADLVMYVDGQHQANTTPLMVAYHRLLGTVPVAVHPDPRSALVIGLGGGVSPGSMSRTPDIDLTVVELSAEVVAGARLLGQVNYDVVDRSNVDIRVDDGRNHLLLTDERYDIITADVIQPTHANAGKLWSVEYWTLARDALADGGIMMQWVPQASTRSYELIASSFLSVFPHVTAWAGGSILIGSNEPIVFDPSAFEERLAQPGWDVVLGEIGVADWDTFAALFTADDAALRAALGDGPVLTDDRPQLEYYRTLSGESDGWDPATVPQSPVDAILTE